MGKHVSFLISLLFFYGSSESFHKTKPQLQTMVTCSLTHIYCLFLIHGFTFFTLLPLYSEIICIQVHVYGSACREIQTKT